MPYWFGDGLGTGKTLESIELDQRWYQEWYDNGGKGIWRTLVVAPLNTFSSWQDKYAKQAPDVKLVTIDRKKREAFIKAVQKGHGDVFLCHWDALRLMPELQKMQFNVVIADEVHRISNRKVQTTRALKKIPAHHKIAMSGTASGDKPENLWSVLNWLYPKYYSSYWRFRNHYCLEEMTYDASGRGYRKIVGVKNTAQLTREMSPWYVRHLKREQCCEHHPNGVMEWLPEKIYERVYVDLSPTQRRVYNQMRQNMVAWVDEHDNSPLVASVVIAQLTRLSQIALATPEVSFLQGPKDAHGDDTVITKVALKLPSSKMDALKEILDDNPDKAFVVFTSSKQMANLVADELQRTGTTCCVLSGDTPDAVRQSLVSDFNKGRFRVVVGVIMAIAEGIDGLQHTADTGIFLDRSWSTLKNKQAEDRLHRDGQKDTVTIIDIMARDTVDFGRATTLEMKWQNIKAILGDKAQRQITSDVY